MFTPTFSVISFAICSLAPTHASRKTFYLFAYSWASSLVRMCVTATNPVVLMAAAAATNAAFTSAALMATLALKSVSLFAVSAKQSLHSVRRVLEVLVFEHSFDVLNKRDGVVVAIAADVVLGELVLLHGHPDSFGGLLADAE